MLTTESRGVKPALRLRGLLWTVRLAILLVLLGLFGPLTTQVLYVTAGTNFHAVIPGQVYRGAQLSQRSFRELVQKHQIRTVINLRGKSPGYPWYEAEQRTLQELGVTQRDIMFSSYYLPGVPEFRELAEALETCERPILVHCRRGSDRTGVAAAVALLLCTDADLDEARKQLSWRYGHLEDLSWSGCLREVLEMYETWLAERHQLHKPELLRQWVMEEYRPGQCWAEIEALEVPSQIPLHKPAGARFRVHNRSNIPWHFRQSANCGVHLRFLLRTTDKSYAVSGGAGFFDKVVAPGESIELTLALPAMSNPGRYELMVDMSEEGRCWFFAVGSQPYETELVIGDERAKRGKRSRTQAAASRN